MEVGERACARPGSPGPSGFSPPVSARPRSLRPSGFSPRVSARSHLRGSGRSPVPLPSPASRVPPGKGGEENHRPGSPRRSVESQNRQGDTQTKWVMSVSKENTPCKSTKISDESKKEHICTMCKNEEILMEKIRRRIGERMDLNADLFNEKLERLKTRVEQLEWTNTYEEISKILLQKKVAKLERCIDTVAAAQGEVFSEPAVAQNERKERTFQQIHIEEENHNYSEDFEAISTSSSKDPYLAFHPELAEKFEDPPQNP